jgi:hypothetical protein
MKKAKILLSAIVLVAVVGGAFAFKANRFIAKVFYSYGVSTTTVGGPTVTGCVVPVTLTSTTALVGSLAPVSSTTFITNTSSVCTATLTAALAE